MPTFPFDPTRHLDSTCNAYCMAAAARAAYFDDTKLSKQLLQTWGLKQFQTFNTPPVQGFIANGTGFTVLSFRGSDHEEVDDWISNADFDLLFDPHIRGGQIHTGFQRSAAGVWPQILQLLADLRPPHSKLFLTGHSLGGALAILTAARFAGEHRADEVDGIFTFGQPRAGDKAFASHYDREFKNRTFRYVNRFDLITRLPPRLLGYEHSGQLRYIDENGVLHENLSLWKQLLMTLNPIGKNSTDYIEELTSKLPGALSDHNGERYIELLKDLCPASD